MIEQALNDMRSLAIYSAWSVPDDFLAPSHFLRVINSLNFQASPGYPLLFEFPTIARYLPRHEGGSFPDDRLKELYANTLNFFEKPEPEMEPVRLFIKQEPLSPSKLSSERYRLISSLPLPLQVLEHMLFDPQNAAEVASWRSSPFRVGHSYTNGERKNYPFRGRFASIDKKCWDWTVPGWAMRADLRFRIQMCMTRNSNPPLFRRWLALAKQHHDWLYEVGGTDFVISSGQCFRQATPGMVKSGSVNTINTNSHLQVLYHHLVLLERRLPTVGLRIMALGDDTLLELPYDWLASQVGEYVKAHERIGALVKEAEVQEDEFKFAGHDVRGWHIRPSYGPKHYARIYYQGDPDILVQQLESYQMLYAMSNAKAFRVIRSLLDMFSPESVLPVELLVRWYKGE